MITPEQEKAIHEALKSLGLKDFTRLEIEDTKGRAVVYIDGERFGVWDYKRQTFVD